MSPLINYIFHRFLNKIIELIFFREKVGRENPINSFVKKKEKKIK